MTAHHYRYSVIPGGAITDERLEPRDFQVLALLGRHAKAGGWLWRSQVKMAGELKCGRATVQRSLDRLIDAGWVEVKLRGRGTAEPDAEKQPFAAHFYRVKLDNDVPDEVLEALATADPDSGVSDDEPDAAAQGGCPPVRHVTDGHQGAHLRGHQEGTLNESERDARASAEAKPHVGAFNRKWPTSSSDDQKRTKAAWDSLGDGERQAALDGIEPFLKKSKADGRAHVIAGWRYIEEKRWTLLPAQPKAADNPLVIKSWSREWWAALLRRIERRQSVELMLRCALSGADWAAEGEPVPQAAAEALHAYPNDGEVMAAWRAWFAQHRINLPEWRTRFWVYLPGPTPDRPAGSTDPPPKESAA